MPVTIMGKTFELSAPYAEGHVVNAAEARTLNQTRNENISNNVRKQLTELKGEGDWTDETLAKAQELISKVDADYTFGMGRTGGAAVSRDPLDVIARQIATEKLSQKLKEKGTTLAAQRKTNKEGIEAKIAEWAKAPSIQAAAQQVLAARQAATANLDDLGDAPDAVAPAPTEGTTDNTGGEPVAETPARGRRQAQAAE